MTHVCQKETLGIVGLQQCLGSLLNPSEQLLMGFLKRVSLQFARFTRLRQILVDDHYLLYFLAAKDKEGAEAKRGKEGSGKDC